MPSSSRRIPLGQKGIAEIEYWILNCGRTFEGVTIITIFTILSLLLLFSLFSRVSAAFARRISDSQFVYGATTCRLLKIHGSLLQKSPIKETLFCKRVCETVYGVATTCRLLKIVGLFCKRVL